MDTSTKLKPEIEALKDMLDPRRRELKNIKELVKHDPSYVKELLGVIEDGLDGFKYQCTVQRDQVANRALTNMLGLLLGYKKIDKINTTTGRSKFCIMSIDAIMYCYPNGYPFQGSLNDKHFVNTFCTFYFDDPLITLHSSEWEKKFENRHKYMCDLKMQWESIKSQNQGTTHNAS